MPENENPEPVREKRSEVLLRFLDSTTKIDAFNGKKIEEVFSTEEQRRNFIENLQPEQFLELLKSLNGILRDKKKEEWSVDGKKQFIGTPGTRTNERMAGIEVPVREEDKEELLLKVLQGAKEMNQNHRNLEDIALLLSFGVNNIHPFLDANGRTSRFLFTILSHGYNESSKKELEILLGDNASEYLDINTTYYRKEIKDIVSDHESIPSQDSIRITKHLVIDLHSDEILRNAPEGRLGEDWKRVIQHDKGYLAPAVYLYLQNQPDRTEYVEDKQNLHLIDLVKLIPTLKNSDIEKIMENFWRLKREHSEILIDSIVNPDKPEFQISKAERKISLLEHIKKSIRDQAKQTRGGSFPDSKDTLPFS